MRSRLTTRPPAASVIPSMRPSTCSGTPEIMCFGGTPSRAGQLARTRSWSAPMPPAVTSTAGACSSKLPVSVRELAVPRAASLGARTAPRTPSTVPFVTRSSSTRCRNRSCTSPFSTAARTRRSKGSTMPGPVPHVTWNRGTELPCPSARYPPRSAQPTTGKNRTPWACSHDRFSPAAKSTYAVAHRRAQKSSPAGSSTPRSNPALPNQSCSARSAESLMPIRRCSGESTRNRPPNDQCAWPPSDASGSWSSRSTRRPESASSAVATRPASPPPTTITSVSTRPSSPARAQASSVSTRSISPASSTSLPVMPPAECVLQRKVTVRQRMSMSGW